MTFYCRFNERRGVLIVCCIEAEQRRGIQQVSFFAIHLPFRPTGGQTSARIY